MRGGGSKRNVYVNMADLCWLPQHCTAIIAPPKKACLKKTRNNKAKSIQNKNLNFTDKE